jgi:hypothetical protein
VNQELLERLAREAGMTEPDLDTREWDHELWKASTDDLHRFAALVASECVKVCDEAARRSREVVPVVPQASFGETAALVCARQIRAMFQEPK